MNKKIVLLVAMGVMLGNGEIVLHASSASNAWSDSFFNVVSRAYEGMRNWIYSEGGAGRMPAESSSDEELNQEGQTNVAGEEQEASGDASVDVQEESNCGICLDPLNDPDNQIKQDTVLANQYIMDCSHYSQFHRTCMNLWIVNNSTCPICRTPLRVFVAHLGGVVRDRFSADLAFGNSVVAQEDGKLVIAGKVGSDILLARYDANGA